MSDKDLITYVRLLKIPHFRGVFMRDSLPKRISMKKECGIVNLDTCTGSGTHWTAYVKHNDNIIYYDSYGNLVPPKEVVQYFKSSGDDVNIRYNYETTQKFNSHHCGQYCLKFLYSQTKN